VIWDGSIDQFKVFTNNFEGHYGQIDEGYLFNTEFQTAYLERDTDCFDDFLVELPSASKIKKETCVLHGAYLSSCQSDVGVRILMKNRN
jgi:hypothetical protein